MTIDPVVAKKKNGLSAEHARTASDFSFDAQPAHAAAEDQLAFWTARLAGVPEVLELPTDRTRPSVQSEREAVAPVVLPAELTADLRRVSQERGVSIAATIYAAWCVVLSRLSGQQDLVVGLPAVAGGARVNTLPVRMQLEDDPTVLVLLDRVKQNIDDAHANKDLSFEQMVAQRVQSPSHSPLVQVMFSLRSPGDPQLLSGLRVASAEPQSRHFDLALSLEESGDVITGRLAYATDLFDAETVERWVGHLEVALRDVVGEPQRRVSEVDVLTDGQRRQILEGFNAGTTAYPDDALISELVERQAERTPNAHAATYDGQSLTYAQLNERANQLAWLLREKGVGPDKLVGICVERSLDMVVGLLAILKAGGAYVPLDPEYPADRLVYMLEDAKPSVALTQTSLLHKLEASSADIVVLDRDADDIAARPKMNLNAREFGLRPHHLAYVIYTSGSTGKPKGVMIEHRNVSRLFTATDHWFHFNDRDVWTVFHSFAFDFSVWELWGALAYGGRVVVVPYLVARSPQEFYRLLCAEQVTVLNQTPSAFVQLIEAQAGTAEQHALRVVVFGGEALELRTLRPWIERNGSEQTQLVNMYGITETTVHVTYRPLTPQEIASERRSLIGKAIPDLKIYLLDSHRRLVPVGVSGEIFVGGAGVARGYLNRPELSAERMLPDPFSSASEARMYKSGDLARWRPDGSLEYIGRNDHQVKIRGFRIELGEIAAALSAHASVKRAAVTTRNVKDTTDKQIVAYLVPNDGASIPPAATLREFLRATLPDYMVPTFFVTVDDIPLTSNGKADFRALPDPIAEAPQDDPSYVAPETPREQAIADAIAGVVGLPRLSVVANFFDAGASSLAVVRAGAKLRSDHGWAIPVVRFFEHPTVRALAASLDEHSATRTRVQPPAAVNRSVNEPIAIVGMAARLPGASNVREYWRNLIGGVDSVSHFGRDGVDPIVPAVLRNDPAYVPARGILEDADKFDAPFFAMTPREAQLMDPQQRLFLEMCWEALEDAGYVPGETDTPIGVFGGVFNNSYQPTLLSRRPDLVEQYGAFNTMLLNEKDFVATRAAHKLGLTGPALSIHTACSTSLVAVCQAAMSLRSGQCGIALAGGVSVTAPIHSGHLYQEGGMLSSDGTTRSFDASASGTVFSDGAGMVVLKRLSDAERDRDTIYAVVRGIALNNDGANKASFTAPSVEGQATVVAAAHADAGVLARDISYVEAHGTATPLGDPIEIEGLTRAFRLTTDDTGYCALGSVKSNIGHTVVAAGVAGLIKTALAMREEVIPPSLHFEKPNPAIPFETSPFVVVNTARAWPRGDTPRLAGVSSFGVGGTNAHVVVEEAPVRADSDRGRPEHLLPLAARSVAALEAASEALAAALRRDESLNLADVAYTQQVGRKKFPYRRAVVCTTRDEAIVLLTQADAREKAEWQRRAAVSAPDVAFMFPGQGAQYVGMGSILYEHEPIFREEIDRLFAASRDVMKRDLRSAMFDQKDAEQAARDLRETSVTQPALFAIEYALAKLWESFGVGASTMIGHSVGEFVAATLAGVFSPEDAIRLVATRGQLMGSMPSGSMLSVRLDAGAVAPRLGPELSMASDNAPGLCVVAGPTPAVEALRDRLVAEDVACSMLHTSHAFHSAMMDPAVEQFAAAMRGVTLSQPTKRFISCVTGSWIAPSQATDPSYWANHLRQTVRFAAGAQTIGRDAKILLEVGPRTTLASLAKLVVRDGAATVASLKDGPASELRTVLSAAGDLWRRGVGVDWLALHVGEQRRRISLPKYPFERQSHWVTLNGSTAADVVTPTLIAEATMRDESPSTPAGRIPEPEQLTAMPSVTSSQPRRERLMRELGQTFEQVAGIEVGPDDATASFVELGFDSLTLTQVALAISKSQGVKVAFRQLLEDQSSVSLLADFIDAALPPEPQVVVAASPVAAAVAQPAFAPPAVAAPVPQMPSFTGLAPMSVPSMPPGSQTLVQSVIDQQLRLMAQQLAMLTGMPAASPAPMVLAAAPMDASLSTAASSQNGGATNGASPVSSSAIDAVPGPVATAHPTATRGAEDGQEVLTTGPTRDFYDAKKAFGAAPRITRHVTEELSPKQRARLDAFIRRYTSRTKGSKKFTQDNRDHMADPRVATGFRPPVKELVYPIVIERSKGSRMWDIDGNEYLDVASGFGSNMFGWSAPFVVEAVKEQLDKGFEIGPQHVLTHEVTELFREFTKADRVAFCNTGSEAVLGAIRIARTTTGRNLIVAFAGSYHGINDEVIVRGNKKGKAFPAAPGILPSTAENILVLDYGTPESFATIRSRASEIAAVLVEPVQSRRPDFQPKEFLQELRALTRETGMVYIWDEVVTGFRVAPGGAQEYFGIQADLATYGKVVGGGLSIGVIAGKREYMDALDGGQWQFGDGSVPEVGVTYFAGTFVRHPLALAAARSVLLLLKARGPALQQGLTALTTRFATTLNQWFVANGVPMEIRHFASVWKTFFTADVQNSDLFFYMLRDRGIHIYDGFPCFMTMAHTDEDIDRVIAAFKESVNELREGTFLPDNSVSRTRFDAKAPPVAGARLGRDRNGNPAWFVIDPKTGQPKEFTPA